MAESNHTAQEKKTLWNLPSKTTVEMQCHFTRKTTRIVEHDKVLHDERSFVQKTLPESTSLCIYALCSLETNRGIHGLELVCCEAIDWIDVGASEIGGAHSHIVEA